MKNEGKHADIKLVITETRSDYLVSQSNYYATKFLTENLLAIAIEKIVIVMNKHVCLGLTILDLSKIFMYCFWNYYIKPKYGEKAKLCYWDTDSLKVHVKTNDMYKNIAEDVETGFDISNFEIDRPLSIGKNKKWLN